MFVGNDVLDNVSIQHYYGDTLCEGATMARKHRLYVTNWWMFKEYKKAMSTINPTKNKDKLVSIAYLAGVPVACALTDSRPLTQCAESIAYTRSHVVLFCFQLAAGGRVG